MEILRALYRQTFGSEAKRTERICGSGSNRAYYRLSDGDKHSAIGVVGTFVEENHAFIHITRHFTERQLPVPQILAVSDDGLRYLQTDLGDLSLFELIKKKDYTYLKDVMRSLVRFQVEGGKDMDFSVCYPQKEFDRDNVMFDLNYFKYCFLKPMNVDFHECRLQHDFEKLADMLCEERADEDLFMYRDFQSRNVMIHDGKPFFIDYQGGRRGPLYYDVASFLWQASAQYPETLKAELIEVYYNELATKMQVPSKEDFMKRLQLFVFFRTLQVLGAYGYRGLFERKKHFLDSIPAALKNLEACIKTSVADNLPELMSVAEKTVMLEVKKCSNCSNGKETILSNNSEHFEQLKTVSELVVRVFSFSYKQGIPQDESGNGGGYVFDCRSTHNPGRYEEYKTFTGLDECVKTFLEEDGEILTFLESVYKLADHHVERYIERGFTDLMFSFGCTGGQHRSVYCAQHLAEHLHERYGIRVVVHHIAQNKKFEF